MSAAPRYDPIRYDPTIGIVGLTMTADEYLALGETPERTELIHGLVVMSPSPVPLHRKVFAEVITQIRLHCGSHPGVEMFPDTDVRFAEKVVYRPDVSVYAPGRFGAFPSRLTEPPDLVVEILPGGTKMLDLITKRDDYDEFGVAEYWVLDPNNATLRCWQRQKSRPVEIPVEGDEVASSAIAGFVLDLKPIRAIAAGR